MSDTNISQSSEDSVLRETYTYIHQRQEWQIKNFFDLPLTPLTSPSFPFYDSDWFLDMYQNGLEATGWVSLYLNKMDSTSEISVDYTIGIKKTDGSVFISLNGKRSFGENKSWGWPEFVTRSDLIESKEDIAPVGILKVFCCMRLQDASTYGVGANLENSSSDKLDECKREIKDLKENLSSANKEKETVAADTQASSSLEIRSFTKEITELKEKLAAANKENDAYKTEITELKRNLEVANKEKDDSEKEIVKLKEKLVMANKEKDDSKREITESREELAVANKEKTQWEREMPELGKMAMAYEDKETRVVNIKNTEQDVKQGATRLLQNLRELAPDHGECDVKITFGDKEYMVHGSVLSAKSEVFRRMLKQEDIGRKREETLNITKGDPVIFENFLLFMYTEELENVSLNKIVTLYGIADHYKVEDLKKACARSLACNMSMEFMIDVQRAIFFRDLAKLSNTETDSLIYGNE